MTWRRCSAWGVLTAFALAGCAHTGGTASRESPSPEVTDLRVDAAAVGSFFAGLDEVRGLGFPAADMTHVDSVPLAGVVDATTPCGPLQSVAGRADLGEGWSAFRRLSVTGASVPHQLLEEAVAVYPDPSHAQGEFRRLTEAFDRCGAGHGNGLVLGMRNRIKLAWTSAGPPSAATDVHVTGNVLYEVTSSGAGDDPQVAGQVADQVKTNIVDPA